MNAKPIVAELYTTEECSLCREMRSVLEHLRGEYSLAIREIDIRADAALFGRFAQEIPVLYLDGRKAFKYRVTEAALRRRLAFLLWQRRILGVAAKEPS
jgi:thiol-disulfide isomerase/thioredoxin